MYICTQIITNKQKKIMKTQKFTFETVQELQAKQAELKNIHGEENVVFNYGAFEKFNYNLTVHIFN